MNVRILFFAPLFVPVLALSGCRPAVEQMYASSEQVQKLPAELQAVIAGALEEHCGTAARPKLLGDDAVALSHLVRGEAVYRKRCEQCHGFTGDGNGPQGCAQYPRLRDYRRGIFKFTSTPYGFKPRREDLLRTIERGVAGTSMPSFRLLPKSDREAVIDYVLVLTRRGELEQLLAGDADAEGELTPERMKDSIDLTVSRWHKAEMSIVYPVSPPPVFATEHVSAGKQAFLTKGCSKCHGEDGRGHSLENFSRRDVWGQPTRAADLTSGMLHGGQDPLDIYRRIYSGINGTPMPGFSSALEQEPETIWNLVAYVLYVSNRRRVGEIPDAGLLNPVR